MGRGRGLCKGPEAECAWCGGAVGATERGQWMG